MIRARPSRLLRSVFLAILAPATGVVLSACPSDGPSSPPPPGYYGEFQFSRSTQSIPGTTTVFMYADARFTTSNGFLDAGTRVTLEGPAGEIPLIRREFLGRVFYQKDPDGPDIPESTFVPLSPYSMHVAGTHKDGGVRGFDLDPVFTLPDAFTITSPDFSLGEIVVDGTVDVPLTWTAGNGQYIDIILGTVSNGALQQVAFRTPDDGSYSMPSGGIATLKIGTGSITVVRVLTTEHSLPDLGTGLGIGADAVACRLVKQ